MRKLLSTCFLLTAGCASMPPDAELVPVSPDKQIEVTLGAGEAVTLDLPVGEVSIEAHTHPSVSAVMSIRCAPDSRRCRAWAEKAAFVAEHDDAGLILGVSRGARSGVAVRTSVRVPADRPLELRMGYGEVDVTGLAHALDVRMSAGDIDVTMPLSAVRSAHLSATFGDASLYVGGTGVAERRPLLVGARVDWEDGPGPHPVVIRLRAGDVQLQLVE